MNEKPNAPSSAENPATTTAVGSTAPEAPKPEANPNLSTPDTPAAGIVRVTSFYLTLTAPTS